MAFAVVTGYALINLAQDQLLQPVVMGSELNLSPLVVFVAVIVWAWILGPAGALLAVPMTVGLVMILESFPSSRGDRGPAPQQRRTAAGEHRRGSRAMTSSRGASEGMADAAPAGAIASAPVATPAQPTPSRRAIVRRALVLVGLVVFVFGVVLPRLVDPDAVRAALAALTPGQLALLGATSIVAYVASAGPSRVLVPGLSWPHAVGSDLAARAVASTVPGPTDVATRFALYRQWSIPTDVASAGIALAALFETVSAFAVPMIAAVGVLFDRQPTQPRVLLLALVGLVVLVAAAALLVSMVRSERLARKLGGWLDSMARRIWTLFRKTPPTGIVEGTLDLRERSKTMLTQHGLLGFAAAVVTRLAWFVVLEVALWCVGIGPDVLPPSAVLAAMAVVGIVSLVPITPGAVGVAEVAYIGILSSVAGPGDDRAAHGRGDAVPDRPVAGPDPHRVGAPDRDAAGPLGAPCGALAGVSGRCDRATACDPCRSGHPRATITAWAIPHRRSPFVPLASWHEEPCMRACRRESPRG